MDIFIFDDFWKDFWPNFVSNIISGIVLTYIITLIIDNFRKPKVDIVLAIASSVKNRRILNFYCVNNGRTGLMPDEIQWHIYFDESFKLQNESIDWLISHYNGRSVYILNGTNKIACLPGSSCLLASIDTIVDSKNFPYDLIDEAPFYYSLTTTKGEKSKSSIFKRDRELDFIEDLSFIKRRVFKIEKISI